MYDVEVSDIATYCIMHSALESRDHIKAAVKWICVVLTIKRTGGP